MLVLLPIPGSCLQACFSGPYCVEKKVGEFDYLVATLEGSRKKRLCHINMLKPYQGRNADPGLGSQRPAEPPVEEVADGVVKPGSACTLAVCSVGSVGVGIALETGEDDVEVPSKALVQGRLKNSEMLTELDAHLAHLPDLQRADVAGLIFSRSELFSDVPSCTSVLQHDIDVGGSPPIKQHAYRVNPDKRRRLKKEVGYMLEHGIAEPSLSSWSSPCLLVDKSDKSDRFCTDFRKVNNVTKPDSYPLPRVEDCVDRVGSASYVTKLDLLKGYWQVPLTERAKEISAFVTPDDFLQYKVMAFGMRNAPATFQRLVNTVLSGVPGCEAYLDDVVVHSDTWQDHMEQLSEVFDRLSKANLTLNLAKCDFGQATVVYLGKVVGRGEVRTVQAKVEAIHDFPAPASRRDLRCFLGMAGYYRGFCKNFSAVAAPLTDLISPKVRFVWSEGCQYAFEQIKDLLSNAPVLAAPNFEQPFKLAIDACDVGAGAVLLQDGADGVEHPVSYFSRKFNRHQRVYSTIEKEALAIVLALDHFEVYVGSASVPVAIYTDHNPLVYLKSMRNTNQRLMRWSIFMQAFNVVSKLLSIFEARITW